MKKEITILKEQNTEQDRKIMQEPLRRSMLVLQPQLSSTLVARALSTTDKDKLITQLVQDRDVKEPLGAVGAAVRLRFLETAKGTALSIAIDRDIVTDGNDAAHRGDDSADAALFKMKLIPGNDTESASFFNTLYKISPAEHASSFPKLKEALDCHATIIPVQPLNSGNNSAVEREEHGDVLTQIFTRCRQMGEEFQKSPVINTLLERLKDLIDDIVSADRQTGPRGRTYIQVSCLIYTWTMCC